MKRGPVALRLLFALHDCLAYFQLTLIFLVIIFHAPNAKPRAPRTIAGRARGEEEKRERARRREKGAGEIGTRMSCELHKESRECILHDQLRLLINVFCKINSCRRVFVFAFIPSRSAMAVRALDPKVRATQCEQ